jgi:hypothetical protein
VDEQNVARANSEGLEASDELFAGQGVFRVGMILHDQV